MLNSRSRRASRRTGLTYIATMVMVLALLPCAGCASQGAAGRLRTVSLGDEPVVLYSHYREAYFSDANSSPSFMLTDMSLEQLIDGQPRNGQIIHVELLWRPSPGRTPMDASATNASIRYVIISNGEIGVYSGAGFASLDGSPATSDFVAVTLRDASLQLQDSTPGFADLLSPAQMTGTFKANRDDRKTRQLNRAASQLVTNALGKTVYVLAAE